MVERSEQIVLDYLLSSNKGEVLKKDGRTLKKLKIDDKIYKFDRRATLTDRLKRKLNSVRQTIDYKKYELENRLDVRWTNLYKNKALTGIQKRFKATVSDEQSAFKGYVNSYSITDIKVQGIKALQYLKYQDVILKKYLNEHKGLKVFVEAYGVFKSKKMPRQRLASPATKEDVRTPIRSRRYNITNADDVSTSPSQMATDIELLMDRMELSESGLVTKQIEKLKFYMTNIIQHEEAHTLNFLNGFH